jgi:hypothetical protein
MTRSTVAVLILGIGLGAAAPGCGGGSGNQVTLGPGELEGSIRGLPEGASIELVIRRLGEPFSENAGKEGIDDLYYRDRAAVWTLRFKNGEMESRTKSIAHVHPASHRGNLQPEILALHPGDVAKGGRSGSGPARL